MDIKRYILNSQLDSYKYHLDQSIAVINQALSLDISWYVAWSGGKDSTVLAHLVNNIYPKIPVWSEKDDCDFPNELEYVQKVANKYGFNLEIVMPEISLWQAIIDSNININEDLHSKGTTFSDTYFYSLIEKQECKYGGVFLGLRKEESKGRKWNYITKGYTYQRKNGKYTCIPLSNWTGTDIFSYLITNDIPILDIYNKTKFVDNPEKVRKAWYLPSARANKGFCSWLKYYYPELFTSGYAVISLW